MLYGFKGLGLRLRLLAFRGLGLQGDRAFRVQAAVFHIRPTVLILD